MMAISTDPYCRNTYSINYIVQAMAPWLACNT
jgi:hypothetical protein